MLFMEYRNIEQNIYPEEFNEKAQTILGDIKKYREEEWAKDPNAFQMTNLFLLGAKYADEGYEINKETLKEMWEIRSKDFARCGVHDGGVVYGICEDAYKASQLGNALVNDVDSHCALRKMAGIGLFFHQKLSKGEKLDYNNPGELCELIENSKTLKILHPDLFERYGFEPNLQMIAKLQSEKENSLQGRIGKAMESVFGEQTTERKADEKEQVKERE